MEVVLAIAGVTALVWGAVVFLRGGLLGGALLVLLAGCCFGHPLFHAALGPVPLTIDRALFALFLAQYVVWRRLGWADPKPLGAAEIALAALIAVLGVSTLAHDWQARNAQPAARLLLDYLMPLGMYWVARQSRITERGVLTTLACLAGFGLYLALTAAAEAWELRALVFPAYITSPDFPEFYGRARGPLLNPVGNGILLGVGLAAGLMAWPRWSRRGRLLVVATAAVLCLGIYGTLTRSVWIGAVMGLLLTVGLAVPRRPRACLFAGALILAAVAAVTQWERVLSFKRDRDLSAQETAESAKLRPILAMVAWQMFRDRPMFGCGFGQYPERSVEYLSDRAADLPLEKARPFVQHNVFLALLTETGLIGAGLFVLVLVLWLRDAWRLWRCPEAPLWARQHALVFMVLVVNYAVNGMFHDVSLIAMIHMLLFFLAGVTSGLCPLSRPAAAKPESRGKERRPRLLVAAQRGPT